MKQILGLIVGITVGGALGAVLIVAFAPTSGKKFRRALDKGYHDALIDARTASVMKRQQLAAEYQRLTR